MIRELLVRTLAGRSSKSGSLSGDLRDVASDTYRHGTGALLCALLSAASKILSYFMLAFRMDLSSGEIVPLSGQRLKMLVRLELASASTATWMVY